MLTFRLRSVFTGISTPLADVQSVRLHQLAGMFTEASCHWLITPVYNPSWCLLVTCYYDYKVDIDWLNSLKSISDITDIISCQSFLKMWGLLYSFNINGYWPCELSLV